MGQLKQILAPSQLANRSSVLSADRTVQEARVGLRRTAARSHLFEGHLNHRYRKADLVGFYKRTQGVGSTWGLAHRSNARNLHVGYHSFELLVTRTANDEISGLITKTSDEFFLSHVTTETVHRIGRCSVDDEHRMSRLQGKPSESW